ncbi:bifunctional precorrin-2 dehydrogenase/sirohydrochlorin ferrochelatase [uncultured Selenomonas sp.]|uniref:precorrin-2 dehydrogenase/sirohydrochlorin ferrochelatase family protein n=1 Tax=uncultured Selenomonas sp. TaxID=159275 RepID=UPI001CB2E370|nr:bifunctional precorrin-2 dehydrogenase/sirohydrochlorin ferrochelatase [uncultured Selenomonas sp.]MBF1714788.1 bifunctional precorrin-2 dehydrogenase/sirohydrochlorin ferrochelatase [Selenomonas sp.]
MLYPLNVDLSGRSLILVGGGRVAERKVRGILSAGTETSICVIAPKITMVLQEHAAAGRLCWKQACYADGMLEGAFLVYAATDMREVNAAVAAEAKRRGIPVNVIDDPAASTFQVPASIRRGELILSVSTAGGSPALSRAIRMELEEMYPPAFGMWLERVSCLRVELQECISSSSARTRFWHTALRPDILTMVRHGAMEKAEVELRNAALDFGAQSSDCTD